MACQSYLANYATVWQLLTLWTTEDFPVATAQLNCLISQVLNPDTVAPLPAESMVKQLY